MIELKEKNKHFTAFFKGILIGFGTVVPGVSGGTVAVITGIFEDILEAVGNIFSHIKGSLFFLIPVMSGASLGVFILSMPLEIFCEASPVLSKFVFCAVSLLGCVGFIKKGIEKKQAKHKYIYVIIGACTAFAISFSIHHADLRLESSDFISLLLIGLVLSLALVLPAISFSYMLLFFGIYEKTLNAIHTVDILYLLPLGTGILFGSYIFSKLLLKLIERNKEETYLFVFGFVISSVAEILGNF